MASKKGRGKQDHRTRVGRERSARTETRILEAALAVFAEAGPDAPKIDDFVAAAGVSRGTFYNYFESVDVLLAATSAWTTREIIDAIGVALAGIDDPAIRLGVGIRLFLAKAQANRVWSLFIARVWKIGALERPMKDVTDGLRTGVFRAPSAAAAHDMIFGGLREALLRIGNERTPSDFGAQVTEMCLQALGTDARKIAAALKHEVVFIEEAAPRRAP